MTLHKQPWIWPLLASLPLVITACEDAGSPDPSPTQPVVETQTEPPVVDPTDSPTATEPAATPTATALPTPTQAPPTPTRLPATPTPETPTPPTTTPATPTLATPTPATPTPHTPTPATPTPTLPTDADGDGYSAAQDCDDANAAVHPGADEVCNSIDDDCDGRADDQDEPVVDPPTWHPDFDDDGYGSSTAPTLSQCAQPTGYALTTGDCDDADPAFNPGAAEEDCTDPNDYNCDGSVGYADGDGDGYPACEDCDDAVASINPGATETCDNVDQDCDGAADEDPADPSTFYADEDGDGYGDPDASLAACQPPPAHVSNARDCDDSAAGVNPDADELCNGAVDDDCDGRTDEDPADAPTWYLDADGDGFGRDTSAQTQCAAPTSFHTQRGGDCDDLRPAINPEATEVCNDVDDDCDTLVDDDDDSLDPIGGHDVWADEDADGFGDPAAGSTQCVVAEGWVTNEADCDDADPGTHPGATEVCDGEDNDCDGDSDGDAAGEDPLCAARTCLEIHRDRPDAPSGVYYIDPSEDGAAFQVWCDMETDGGGWTVLEKSPRAEPVGKALYRDVAVNEEDPSQPVHRLSRARMEALTTVAGDLRIDCRGEDYLEADSADLFAGESGPNSCSNWVPITYRDASLKGNRVRNRRMITWMVGKNEGCAGAWHIDEHAQQGYANYPNFPWTGAAISNSSADHFAADPNTVDSAHECHVAGATRFVMVRPTEVCGSGVDEDGDGAVDEGSLGLTPEDPGASCQAILEACPSERSADGRYWIAPDLGEPVEVYCDMTTDGGGWTMVASFNNDDGEYRWTQYASETSNLGAWRDESTFGSLDTFEDADYKSPAFARAEGTDLLALDALGGYATYRGALDGTLLDTLLGYSGCQTTNVSGVEVRSSDALIDSVGKLSYYGADPNNGSRCAFNNQVDSTDSSVIAMAHQGCGTAGFGHVGWLDHSSFHNDRDFYFCLGTPAVLNTSDSCGKWFEVTTNLWFNSFLCDYATLFVR